MPKIKVYKMTVNGEGSEFIADEKTLSVFIPELESALVGEKYVISVEEMEKEDYDNLPEFDGF